MAQRAGNRPAQGAGGKKRQRPAQESSGKPPAKKHQAKKQAGKPAKGKPETPQAPTDKLARKIEKKPILKHVREVVALWEEMQPRKSSAEVKKALAVKITQVGKGHLKELSANHASSRAVQAALKHGGAPARAAVWAEVKEGVLDLAMSPHGSFVLRKIIALADKGHLSGILRACKGSVVKLFRHPTGSAVMAELYNELPPAERNALVAEFYSREFSVLGGAQSAAGQMGSLVAAWEGMEGPKRRAIMKHLILALSPIIEKAYVDPAPIHRLLSEYLTLAPADMLQDAVDMLAGEATLRIIHTHDGCRAGCMVAAYGSPKERKKLLKAIKGNAMKMAADNFAYIALVQVLRVVDDTQLVRKCAVQELAEHVSELCGSPHGIKVVLSLLTGGEKHLPPHAVALLHPPERLVAVPKPAAEAAAPSGAEDANEAPPATASPPATDAQVPQEEQVLGASKKDAATRRAELVGAGEGSFARALLAHCTENAGALLRRADGGKVVEEAACGHAGGASLWQKEREQVCALHSAIAQAVAPVGAGEGDAKPLIEDLFASRALRRMVLQSADAQHEAARCFAQTLWAEGLKGCCASTVEGHGGKVLAALADVAQGDVRADVREQLRPCVEDVDEWCGKFRLATG